MVNRCRAAVRMATGDVFSDADIDDFLNRMAARARLKRTAEPTLQEREAIAQAAKEMTAEEIRGALIEKRVRLAAEAARTLRRGRLDVMVGDESQRLSAYDVGTEKQGLYSGSSVDAEGRAMVMDLWGQVETGLDKVAGLKDRASNFFGASEREFDRKIAREMARLNGAGEGEPTGDDGALHAARVFNAALEKARGMQNDQGAWIDRLQGYIARQSHNREKIAGSFWRELGQVSDRLKAGDGRASFDWAAARQAAAKRAFREWRDFVLPRLDPKTFDGLEEEDVPFEKWEDEAQESRQLGRRKDLADAAALHAAGVIDDPTSLRERMLYRVWFDIATGRHEALGGADDLGDFRPPASTARSVSRARTLHFASPDAWMDYQARYGSGSLFSTVMSQLERGGRNTALMRRWGPSPDAARAAEIERLSSEARGRNDPGVVKKLNSARQQAEFDQLNGRGSIADNMRLAKTMSTIRTLESLSKLGAMVLSKTTDLPMAGHTMARFGAGFLSGYDGALRGVFRAQSKEAAEAADLLHVGARSFAGHLGGQFNAADGLPGWTSWASRLHYKLNMFDFVNEGVRRGIAEMTSRHLGDEAAKPLDQVHPGTRETLERFGIGADMWDASRKGLSKASDGKTYFTTEHLTDPEARLRFQTMVHNILDDAVSEPRARERVSVTAGLRPGTPLGEAARMFSQFHGFIRTILGRHLAPAAAGYAGYAPVALMAHFIVASALAGFVSMQAKQIAAGRTPRPVLDENGAPDLKLWGAALAQGGGLGIYGDFLFGEANRQGLSATLSAFGGPTVSDAEQVASIVRTAVQGNLLGDEDTRAKVNENLPGELAHFGATHVPLVNLWYTRVALDYLVLWRLQEAASPGYLQRYEDNVRNRQHTDFIVAPTSVLH